MTDPEGIAGSYFDAINERGPDTTARVVVQATWRGLIHKCEKAILPEVATHYVMDKAVWDATIEVRRALVKQQYPAAVGLDEGRRVEFRNEVESMGAVHAYLTTHPKYRFELVPPDNTTSRWRAYFKTRPQYRTGSGLSDIELNPAVGVGSTMYLAVENLLRHTEGREPIDG